MNIVDGGESSKDTRVLSAMFLRQSAEEPAVMYRVPIHSLYRYFKRMKIGGLSRLSLLLIHLKLHLACFFNNCFSGILSILEGVPFLYAYARPTIFSDGFSILFLPSALQLSLKTLSNKTALTLFSLSPYSNIYVTILLLHFLL